MDDINYKELCFEYRALLRAKEAENMELRKIIQQLQNTSSNKKYTAPQATPKSCPNCNSENILRNEKHNHYGCLACHHEWA